MTEPDDQLTRETTDDQRPLTLESVCQAIFGDRWQTQLARRLHVNDRTVRRWHTGQTVVHARIWDELHALVKVRAAELREASDDLERYLGRNRSP